LLLLACWESVFAAFGEGEFPLGELDPLCFAFPEGAVVRVGELWQFDNDIDTAGRSPLNHSPQRSERRDERGHDCPHWQRGHFRLPLLTVDRCRRDLGEETLPTIRRHGLRHTHATHLLSQGEQVKVVSERLGHSSPVVTGMLYAKRFGWMTVYAHVLPGRQREAAARFAAAVEEARR
jgi:hypothetical protein